MAVGLLDGNMIAVPSLPRRICTVALALLLLVSPRVFAQDDPSPPLVVLNNASLQIDKLQTAGDLVGAAKVGIDAVGHAENIMNPSEPLLVLTRVKLAFVLQRLDRREEAEYQLQNAEHQARISNNSPLLSVVLSARASLNMQMGLGMSSMAQARQALALDRAAYPRNEGRLIDDLIFAASTTQLNGGGAEALSLYVEADRLLAARTGNDDDQRRFSVALGLVQSYSALDDEDRLVSVLKRLLQLAPTPEEKLIAARQNLVHDSAIALNRGDWLAATALTAQIQATGRDTFPDTPEIRAGFLESLAFEYARLADGTKAREVYYRKAADLYAELFKIYRTSFDSRLYARTEPERHQLAARLQSPLANFYSFCYLHRDDHPEGLRDAYNIALWQKTLVAASLEEQHARLAASASPALHDQLQTLRAKRLDLSNRVRLGGADPIVESLRLDVQRLESDIDEQTRQSVKPAQVTEADIVGALPPKDAAVEIIVFPFDDGLAPTFTRVYFALVLKPGAGHPLTMVRMGDAPTLEWNQTRFAYIHGVERHVGVDSVEADGYSSIAWQALEPAVVGARHVYLAPNGVLETAPFLAWQGTLDKRLLVERDDLDIRPVFTTADLAQRPPPHSNSSALLIGFADFDAAAESPSAAPTAAQNPIQAFTPVEAVRSGGFGPVSRLQSSGHEVEAIYATLKLRKWTVDPPLENSHASKQAVLAVAHPRVLHIATHGFFNPVTGPGAELDALGLENSLESSGLLLAGANRTLVRINQPQMFQPDTEQLDSDNGFLSAEDVAFLDLRGTELVALSACQTGLGQRSVSSGVLGLRRSFHVAGAESVLVSMWRVDDDVTAHLMARFYQIWLDTAHPVDKQTALKIAAREVRAAGGVNASPRLWAAFVLYGTD